MRHPLYLANFLIALGIVAQPNNWWLIGIFCLTFAVYYERIMYTEEAFLLRKFGEDFRLWADSTPTFIPRMSGYCPAANKLNIAKIVQSEAAAVAVITVSFTVIEIAEHARTDLASVEPWWVVFASLGVTAYVLSRIYKRYRWNKDLRGTLVPQETVSPPRGISTNVGKLVANASLTGTVLHPTIAECAK